MIFDQGYNDVLQIKTFQDGDKVRNISQDNVYEERSIINKYNNTDKKGNILIP